MILKAGTYRFNDVLDFSNIPTGQDNDYLVDVQYTFTLSGLGDVLFDCDIIQINHYPETSGDVVRVNIDKSTPDVSFMFWGWVRTYENGIWGEGYEAHIDIDALKNVTIPYDQEVDETFGTWYISNTNYNEVNKSSLVTIEYNGSTIAELNAGETATLSCNGFAMASDVVVKVGEIKKEETDSIVGTWVFNDNISFLTADIGFTGLFTTAYEELVGFNYFNVYTNSTISLEDDAGYNTRVIYDDGWDDTAFKTIHIYKINGYKTNDVFDDGATFISWLKANATKIS